MGVQLECTEQHVQNIRMYEVLVTTIPGQNDVEGFENLTTALIRVVEL